MPIDYSIIIPAYNEAVELPSTLTSVLRAMEAVSLEGECIVVDNNSTDSTAAVALSHGADLVVQEPTNQIARARNAGAAKASGRSLIFIDADTRIRPELLVEALHRLEETPCVGGGSVIKFESEVSALGRIGIWLWECTSRFAHIAAGSFIFCRREAFEAVGGYDESLYASEEIRFSRLIKKWGRFNDLDFVILDKAPALTSARKLTWYSGSQILGWIALIILMPFAVRSRKLCSFWYERPKKV